MLLARMRASAGVLRAAPHPSLYRRRPDRPGHDLALVRRFHHHNFAARGWECRLNLDGLPEWVPPEDRSRIPLVSTRIQAAPTRHADAA